MFSRCTENSKVMIRWNSLTAPVWRFWCGASAIRQLPTQSSFRRPRQSCDSGPAVPVWRLTANWSLHNHTQLSWSNADSWMYVCMNTRRRLGSMGSYAHACGLSRNSAVVWDFVRFIIVGDILGEQLIWLRQRRENSGVFCFNPSLADWCRQLRKVEYRRTPVQLFCAQTVHFLYFS